LRDTAKCTDKYKTLDIKVEMVCEVMNWLRRVSYAELCEHGDSPFGFLEGG
jgi:hypothetical protein